MLILLLQIRTKNLFHLQIFGESTEDSIMFGVLKINVLLVMSIVFNVHGQTNEFPGPYCASRIGGCCKNRTDACSVPIQGNLLNID